jgi:MSHA biogenesis protein MshQ
VAHASNPARVGLAITGNGIAFTGGKAMRFGMLRLENAVGSERMDLPIRIQTQYYTGATFATNSADNCTSISAANAAFISTSYMGGITATNMNSVNITGLGATFASGLGNLTLTRPLPQPATAGAVTLTIDLGAESKSYLKGNWGVTTYDANPSSRDAFGLYGVQSQPNNFIYFRENY